MGFNAAADYRYRKRLNMPERKKPTRARVARLEKK
tara:strand:+ start:346 stop:450 length:105 start_codon:yes stop_codon:yes gene_type:complete